MNNEDVLKYYSNPKIQKRILEFAKDREVVGSADDGAFASRPDTLMYPSDILERINRGVVAFHCSVEKWKNPMQLKTELTNVELNEIRKGFDFIIDIDSKAKIEHAKITTLIVHGFLKEYGVESTVKFSGSRGFHISIAENAFPSSIDFKKIAVRYPEVPQALANFIRERIADQILDELVTFEGGVSALINTVETISELSAYQFVDLEKNWGSRHLFRMPFSLHPKKWLVSVPLSLDELKNFNVRDGHGLKIIQRYGIEIVILTGRKSEVVNHRAHDLEIKEIYQGALNKKEVFQKILLKHNLVASAVAFMGDDIVDIPVLRQVGFSVAVADAVDVVKKSVDYVTKHKGGRGAVRELCEMILQAQGKWPEIAERYEFLDYI